MGIAAYNRGSEAIRNQLYGERRPIEFEIMDLLNALPKFPDAGRVFGPIEFTPDSQRNCVWAECPVTGFGFPYSTLHEAVKRWLIEIVGFDNGTWKAIPLVRAS